MSRLQHWKTKLKNIRGSCVIGLTGAPASGKSAVLEMFRAAGFFCVSADALAKEVLTEPECYNRILKKFGPEIVLKDGLPDTRGLSLEIFGDSSKRKWLEGLLHPEILKRIYSLIKKSHSKIAIVEVPLLFEAELGDCFTLTICVSAPLKARRARALKRGWSAAELARRESAQFAAERKAGLSDLAVMNDGQVRDLERKINVLSGFLKASVG
ncbi:MAG TPA: dephospho-CoA kinase [Elusimicrobia bacterium]|nr:dephospho-CoA kinase [Elusimicrobiota bacterium]